MRARKLTNEQPATELRLAAHDAVVIELLQWVIWLLVALVALVVTMMFIGCGPVAVSGDKGWIEDGRHKGMGHPMLVAWDHEGFGDHNKSVTMAMDEFPCDMFVEWSPRSLRSPDVYMAVLEEQRDCHGRAVDLREAQGVAVHCGRHAEVWLRGNTLGLSPTKVYLIAMHELGPVAGLEHDPMQNLPRQLGADVSAPAFVSVMTPNILNHSDRFDHGLLLPMLTTHDEKLLEKRYCRR